jgi:hypothetical protein
MTLYRILNLKIRLLQKPERNICVTLGVEEKREESDVYPEELEYIGQRAKEDLWVEVTVQSGGCAEKPRSYPET